LRAVSRRARAASDLPHIPTHSLARAPFSVPRRSSQS
jgi:hypothetical protein